MQPRKKIIDMFSTFLQFDADRYSGWTVDAKLKRSMQSCLSDLAPAESSEKFWVLYWYKLWQTQSSKLAAAHLSSYLQEICYWAAKKMSNYCSSTQYSVTDLFQIAIAKVDKILNQFDPSQSLSLGSYASIAFRSIMKDVLRQRKEIDICTDWALLHKVSHKRLVQSLQNAGLNQEIARCVLAWNCFKTVYVSLKLAPTRKLMEPDCTIWQKIASLYNSERWSQLNQPTGEVSPEVVEQWMSACAKAVRSYLYPKFVSINLPKSGQDGEFQDDLPAVLQESLLAEVIFEEEERQKREQQDRISDVLGGALIKLGVQEKRLLQMYYGQDLTQQQIAQQLEMKQYSVSRRLSRTRESLLLSLAQWSQDELGISLNSDMIKNISLILEEWLRFHYSDAELQVVR